MISSARHYSFAPADPDQLRDPYPVYHWLREHEPLHWSDLGFWVATRYEDVKAVLRNIELRAGGFRRQHPLVLRSGLRRAGAFLVPLAVGSLRDAGPAASYAPAQPDGAGARRPAHPGHAPAHRATDRRLARPHRAGRCDGRDPRFRLHAADAGDVRHARHPRARNLRRTAGAPQRGRCRLVHRVRDARARHRGTGAGKPPDRLPGLARNAVEAVLRYESSLQASYRTALEDTAVQGIAVARGQRVLAILAAGNRDPRAIEDPDRFDIGRRPFKPLSFGGGIHYCVGAERARAEGGTAFARLSQRLPAMRVDAAASAWRQGFLFRRLQRLHARWD